MDEDVLLGHAVLAVVALLRILGIDDECAQQAATDLVGGVVWAWMGYRFGLWWMARRLRGE